MATASQLRQAYRLNTRPLIDIVGKRNCPADVLMDAFVRKLAVGLLVEHPNFDHGVALQIAKDALDHNDAFLAAALIRVADAATQIELLSHSGSKTAALHGEVVEGLLRCPQIADAVWDAALTGPISARLAASALGYSSMPERHVLKLLARPRRDGTIQPNKQAPKGALDRILRYSVSPQLVRAAAACYVARNQRDLALSALTYSGTWGCDNRHGTPPQVAREIELVVIDLAMAEPVTNDLDALIWRCSIEGAQLLLDRLPATVPTDLDDPLRETMRNAALVLVDHQDALPSVMLRQIAAWGFPDVCAAIASYPEAPADVVQMARRFATATMSLEVTLEELDILVRELDDPIDEPTERLRARLQAVFTERVAEHTSAPPAAAKPSPSPLSDLL